MKYNVILERVVTCKGSVSINANSKQEAIDKVNAKIKTLEMVPESMNLNDFHESLIAIKAYEIVPDFIQSCTVTPTILPMDINTGSKEPTEKDIKARIELTGESYYNARERLREKAYGGKPPDGFCSWGEYWKNL